MDGSHFWQPLEGHWRGLLAAVIGLNRGGGGAGLGSRADSDHCVTRTTSCTHNLGNFGEVHNAFKASMQVTTPSSVKFNLSNPL